MKEKGVYHFVRNKLWWIKSRIKKIARRLYDKCWFIFWFTYSRLFNKPLIYVIGDSHIGSFKNSKLFILRSMGAATAYNLKNNKSTTRSNEKFFNVINKINKKRDIVMLVFGEIDCRIHIYNQYKKNKGKFTITELIDGAISNYGHILKQLKQMGISFCVYGVTAATTQENFYNYPFYASPEMHKKIYREFNERLGKFCRDKGYKYIDVYSKVSDKNGFVKKEYVRDPVHLNGKVKEFVIPWLNKEFGINI